MAPRTAGLDLLAPNKLAYPIIDMDVAITANVVIVVGAGGTGARLLPPLIKVLPPTATVIIVDGDIVEERNLARQHFGPEDVGRYKAEVLAERYHRLGNGPSVIGVCSFLPQFDGGDLIGAYLGQHPEGTAVLVFGCVDSGAARTALTNLLGYFSHPFVYVDAGNATSTGQVVIAQGLWNMRRALIGTGDAYAYIPNPDERTALLDYPVIRFNGMPAFPELWDAGEDASDTTPGCGLRFDLQTVQVNQLAATAALLVASPFLQGTPFKWAGVTFGTEGTMSVIPWSYFKRDYGQYPSITTAPVNPTVPQARAILRWLSDSTVRFPIKVVPPTAAASDPPPAVESVVEEPLPPLETMEIPTERVTFDYHEPAYQPVRRRRAGIWEGLGGGGGIGGGGLYQQGTIAPEPVAYQATAPGVPEPIPEPDAAAVQAAYETARIRIRNMLEEEEENP